MPDPTWSTPPLMGARSEHLLGRRVEPLLNGWVMVTLRYEDGGLRQYVMDRVDFEAMERKAEFAS